MQRFFTKNLFLLIFSAVAVAATGQSINSLTVNTPAGIAGNYEVIRATGGSTSNTPITANAAFVDDGVAPVNDGCTAPTNNLTGSIAFVDRGTCGFAIKAKALQVAGAIAVVICQNVDVWPLNITVAADATITVPVFALKLADCTKIRADIIAGGVNATLQYTCTETDPMYGDNIVWGKNPGEGDFDGGLNDWTVDKENSWEYSPDGSVTGGAYGDGQMVSFSACDGSMVFNSDKLDNDGIQGNFGVGPCPSPCRAALISPAIDLSGTEIVGLFVEFTQALRNFDSEYFLITSKDGGLTWPDTLSFNDELGNMTSGISVRKRLALSGYSGVSNFRMKFELNADYYYFAIDDVVLINESKADVQVNENFYAAAPTLRVPAGQVSEMPFLADVSNIGNGDASGVKVEVLITDPQNADAEIARLTNNYGNLAVGVSQENKPFPDTYTPPATPGRYNGSYVISSTEDPSGTNNTRNFFFEVTENTFANLLPESAVTPANYMSYVLSPWAVGPDQIYYSAGNIYYVVDGKNVTIDKVRFGLANTLASINEAGFINADVYEWVDEDGNGQCSPLERSKVGTNSLFLDASIANVRNIELPIWALDDEGNAAEGVEVDLKDNTTYLVMAHASPLDPAAPQFQLLGYSGRTFSTFDRSANYSAVSTAFDTLGIDRSAGSLFGDGGESAEDVEERNFRVFFNGATQSVVFLEMDVKEATSTYDIADKAQVSTFPNPASRELFIDVTLENVSQNVRVDLVSIDGRMAVSKSFSNVQDSRLRLDLSGIVSGTYSVLIHTDKGLITRKVVVQK
ncbi:MAG: PA domain-containing protein [Saprospiraceae bacterium]